MANSRYDDTQYYNGSSFQIPNQIKVFDGTDWVDLGEKTSYNTTKFCTYNTNEFICSTYYRNDVNIPKTIQIGSGKYMNICKSNGSTLSVDNYHAGYICEFVAEINATTPLYTCYTKNQGDIVNQSYNNYVVEVSGNTCRLKIKSNFSGSRITDGKYVDSTVTKYTSYCWTKGEKVRIYLTRSSNSGSLNCKVYNMSGTLLCNESVSENTQWVGTPNVHRLGSETKNNAGSQSVYGNAKIYSFRLTPSQDRSKFIVDYTAAQNGATTVHSSGGYSGYTKAVGTSVYGQSYSEYIKQTI